MLAEHVHELYLLRLCFYPVSYRYIDHYLGICNINTIFYALVPWMWKFKVAHRSTGKSVEIHRLENTEVCWLITGLLFDFYKASQSFRAKIVLDEIQEWDYFEVVI